MNGQRLKFKGLWGGWFSFVLLIGVNAVVFAQPKQLVPWDGKRLAGSPDPPLPYTVEPIFTQHKWTAPIYIAPEPGTNQLWVSQAAKATEPESNSRIVRIADNADAADSQVLLDLPRHLAYAFCFHPKYEQNGYVYLFQCGPRDQPERINRVSRYTVGRGVGSRIDPSSEQAIIEWKSSGHDGGDLTFGNDGFLYITTGDGSTDSDGLNSGQTLDDLLGAVLRIDVDHEANGLPYSIPEDNPFIHHPGARPEIYAYGLRNPWRICHDPVTDQIWVGMNGQDLWETAYLLEKGANYGWSLYEGSHPFHLGRKQGPTPITLPTIEHPHADFRSLTGGVVYRGDRHPELQGAYIYGDYSTGQIWAMKHDGKQVLWHRQLADTPLQIVSFRVDQRGELIVTDNAQGFFRLIPAPPAAPEVPFPTRLSETGLFLSTAEHRPVAALVPYQLNAPGWHDGALSQHFLAVPGAGLVGFDENKGWAFPDGSALVQTLSLGKQPGDPTPAQRIETRLLLKRQGEWNGYTYRWNDDQSDATLVAREGDTMPLAGVAGNDTSQAQWRFPARAECMTCHSRAAGFVLGATAPQLNRELKGMAGAPDNQLAALAALGLFKSELPADLGKLARLSAPQDETQSVESRVRTYLHVNCSVCHVAAGGGNSRMIFDRSTAQEEMNLVSARPQHSSFGLDDAMLVSPGKPDRSILLHRLSMRGPGQMPPLVSNRVDETAVKLFKDWITQLVPERPFVRAWGFSEVVSKIEQKPDPDRVERGRVLFKEIGCVQCHKLGTEGGAVGPDLTGIGRRVAPRTLLESILEPSKVIAEEYVNLVVETNDGTIHTGRVEREDERTLVLRNATSGEATVISKDQITERQKSSLSNMPAGIMNTLELEQILDLLEYVVGGS